MVHIADLHTHSTSSDGQYTPAELVKLAKKNGLDLLALTDHDTLAGLDEAVWVGRECGLRVLRGIELSAKEYDNLHILGYGFAEDAPALVDICRKLREGRENHKYYIIDFLRQKGVDISLKEVEKLAGGAVLGRPHFAQVMVRRGYVAATREAFDRYLDTEEFLKVKRYKPDAKACIEAIKRSGGKASLAHPYQVRLEDEGLEALVRQLAGYGLDAIECYYPKHSLEQRDFYLRLAERYGLHVTGGSDFHGERIKPEVQLAKWELETDWLLL